MGSSEIKRANKFFNSSTIGKDLQGRWVNIHESYVDGDEMTPVQLLTWKNVDWQAQLPNQWDT